LANVREIRVLAVFNSSFYALFLKKNNRFLSIFLRKTCHKTVIKSNAA